DIDIGVFENPSLNIVSDVLQKTGKFTQKPDNYSRQNRVSLTVVHNNGTPFDIYQHQDSGKYYRVENFNPGCSFVRRFTRFGLKPVSFLGTTFNIPNNPELYLTELYGNDWHIPNPFFDSRVSSMNMEPGMEIISKCYAYCRIGGALERSDTERALAYCDQVLDRFPDDEIALEVQNSQKCLN
ncbi:MAG TPA: hypothetical protein VLB10_04770, partial [Gammaproteobacteria bacterium]|nr:hypothetical protein [Gammaproteobacteria bacterium]